MKHVMYRVLLTGLVALSSATAGTVPVRFIVITPDAADAEAAQVYLACSADGWTDQGRVLERVAPGIYAATLEFERGTRLEYKFTRERSWTSVEKAARGDELQNRALLVDTEQAWPVVVHAVARWADRPPGRQVICNHPGAPAPEAPARAASLTGDIRKHERFRSPQLENERPLLVYLPPGYEDEPQRRYPVLYMHDGQNVFDAVTSFSGVEWRADETAEDLIRAGRLPPLIIVAVGNTPDRLREYAPVGPDGRSPGAADAYVAFLAETVKPFVDRTYRTRPEREHTATGGASMAGLISLYAVCHRPDVFGGAIVMSPSLFWGNEAVVDYVRAHPPRRPVRVWLDLNAAETPATMPDSGHKLMALLTAAGLEPERDFHFEEIAGGRHHERDWAARFPRVLEYLLAPRPE